MTLKATESSSLMNYENTDYNWCQECAGGASGFACNTTHITSMGVQHLLGIMPAIAIIVGIAAGKFCDNTGLIYALGGTSTGANSLFLMSALFCKNRYRLCNVDPHFRDFQIDTIKNDKCCQDTTIGFAITYLALSILSMSVTAGICN